MEKQKQVVFSIIGPYGCGKTTLCHRLVECAENLEHEDLFVQKTVSVSNFNLFYSRDNKKCEVKILDTAGQERFQSLISSFINLSDIIMISIPSDHKDLIHELRKYIDYVDSFDSDFQKIFLITKSDLTNDNSNQIKQNIEQYLSVNKIFAKVFSTSSLSFFGLQQLSEYIFDVAMDILEKNFNKDQIQTVDLKEEKKEIKKRSCC